MKHNIMVQINAFYFTQKYISYFILFLLCLNMFEHVDTIIIYGCW